MDADNKNYNFSGIAGHKKQIEFLKSLFFSGRMPSGLLFYGQKNIGKKFTASAFAASVLCSDYRSFSGEGGGRSSLNFCGKCPSCLSFLNGSSPCFLLIEPSGSAVKIESIHKIDSFLGLTPAYPGYRFIIIDEASSMNASAANALLKMLEEPPEKTVFILTASDTGKLLPTVVSRCLLLSFSPIPDQVLSEVFKSEFPALSNETLKFYSKLSRGSYSAFRGLVEGKYLEKRDFLIDIIFKELFAEYKNKPYTRNPYDISSKFNTAEKEDFELILFILRDIYIYKMLKNEKLLYNEDVADKIRKFALDSPLSSEDIRHMIESTVEHIEKISSYNLNKSIASDSYFSELLSL